MRLCRRPGLPQPAKPLRLLRPTARSNRRSPSCSPVATSCSSHPQRQTSYTGKTTPDWPTSSHRSPATAPAHPSKPTALPALTTARPAHDHARATNPAPQLRPRQRLRSRPPLHHAHRAQTPTSHHNPTAPPPTRKLTDRQQPHTTTTVVRTSLSRSGGTATRSLGGTKVAQPLLGDERHRCGHGTSPRPVP
jgi:hypothetical protein